jgi:dihydroxyacid dehydratase/phosphogluconate dehydratase
MSTNKPRKIPEQLRSHRWFGVHDLRAFGHRSRIRQMGYAPEDYAGKPVIGIINTWSDINQCHLHFKERVEDVKRGRTGKRWRAVSHRIAPLGYTPPVL